MSENTDKQRQLFHDLRNVMSSIFGYTQLLEISLENPEFEEQQKLVRSIADSVKQMNALLSKAAEPSEVS